MTAQHPLNPQILEQLKQYLLANLDADVKDMANKLKSIEDYIAQAQAQNLQVAHLEEQLEQVLNQNQTEDRPPHKPLIFGRFGFWKRLKYAYYTKVRKHKPEKAWFKVFDGIRVQSLMVVRKSDRQIISAHGFKAKAFLIKDISEVCDYLSHDGAVGIHHVDRGSGICDVAIYGAQLMVVVRFDGYAPLSFGEQVLKALASEFIDVWEYRLGFNAKVHEDYYRDLHAAAADMFEVLTPDSWRLNDPKKQRLLRIYKSGIWVALIALLVIFIGFRFYDYYRDRYLLEKVEEEVYRNFSNLRSYPLSFDIHKETKVISLNGLIPNIQTLGELEEFLGKNFKQTRFDLRFLRSVYDDTAVIVDRKVNELRSVVVGFPKKFVELQQVSNQKEQSLLALEQKILALTDKLNLVDVMAPVFDKIDQINGLITSVPKTDNKTGSKAKDVLDVSLPALLAPAEEALRLYQAKVQKAQDMKASP